MQTQEIVLWMQKSMMVLMITSAPIVIVSAVVGVVIAVLQTATQLQDQSISQSVKLGACMLVLILFGGWMCTEVFKFADELLISMPKIVRML
jgi:type III secretory pathway component EscS